MSGTVERLSRRIRCYVTPAEATRGPHGLFRYPAKYLPQIPGAVLDECVPPAARVLDPFAGSGTTLVEAAARGMRAVGLDLNPLAVLVSGVKTARTDPDRLREAAARVLDAALGPACAGAPVPVFRNRDYWFPPESLEPLARLRAAIDLEPDRDLRSVLLVVFLSIVKKCSNASTFQHKLTRSREPDPVTGAAVHELFRARSTKAAARLGDTAAARAEVIQGDARRLPFPDEAYDAVVTHPPYSISFDFVRSFKLYLWWLDPSRDTVALDRLMVGNQRRLVGDPPRLGDRTIDERVDQVLAHDRRDGLAVAWFFKDMERVLAECRRVLCPSGRLALYIGDSQARWVQLRAPDAMAALAERLGFTTEARIPREVPDKVQSGNRRIFVEELQIFSR